MKLPFDPQIIQSDVLRPHVLALTDQSKALHDYVTQAGWDMFSLEYEAEELKLQTLFQTIGECLSADVRRAENREVSLEHLGMAHCHFLNSLTNLIFGSRGQPLQLRANMAITRYYWATDTQMVPQKDQEILKVVYELQVMPARNRWEHTHTVKR